MVDNKQWSNILSETYRINSGMMTRGNTQQEVRHTHVCTLYAKPKPVPTHYHLTNKLNSQL